MRLLEQLGSNRDDPAIAVAREDVREYEAMIAALVNARKQAGITQKQVAEALHTTQPVVSELERFAGNPTVMRLMEYARAVGRRLHLSAGEPAGCVTAGKISTEARSQDSVPER